MVFLSAGAFAFAGASFMKALLLKNTKKTFKEIKKTDKARQIEIRETLIGIFLGTAKNLEKLSSYKELLEELKKELRGAISDYKETAKDALEKEFSKHQSNAFSFGLFGLGYLLLLMLYATTYLKDINLLFIFTGFFFIYSIYNLLGKFVLATVLIILVSSFNIVYEPSSTWIAIQAILFSILYVNLTLSIDNKNTHFCITNMMAQFALQRLYSSLIDRDRTIVIDKNKEHFIGLSKYLMHFIFIGGLLTGILSFSTSITDVYQQLVPIYDFNSHPTSTIAISLILYLILTVFYPSYKLNMVFKKETVEYINERNRIWEQEKYEPLMKLKESDKEIEDELKMAMDKIDENFF